MGKEQPDYISYLLRMWRANGEGKVAWRVSLESPHTGERIGFASLDKLFAYLEAQIGKIALPGEDSPGMPSPTCDNSCNEKRR